MRKLRRFIDKTRNARFMYYPALTHAWFYPNAIKAGACPTLLFVRRFSDETFARLHENEQREQI